MKLTLAELEILLDTLKRSLRIADNANLFSYTREQREVLMDTLLARMSLCYIDDIEDEI